MIEWVAVLAVCQLAGETIVRGLQLPIPGPVCGMAILFCGLLLHGRTPDGLGRVADTLLTNLSLLFVPAGAGIMLHFKLLSGDWLPLAAGLIASTLLTIAVTATVMSNLTRKAAPPVEGGEVD